MAQFEYVESIRGGKLVLLNDFLFRIRRKHRTKIYYKCISDDCKASLILENDHIVSHKAQHTHAPDKGKIVRKSFYNELKKRCRTEFSTPVPSIYRDTVAKFASTLELASYLPSKNAAMAPMYRARSDALPPMPTTLEEIILIDDWRKTKNGEDFLLIDERYGENNRILAFCTMEALNILCASNKIFMDGTFKMAPRLFTQIYTIHGAYEGKIFPLLYSLLPDKQKCTYKRLFSEIKLKAESNGLVFCPSYAMMDFEVGAMNALKEEVPSVKIKGCHFHYSQSIWRKVQELGLVSHYINTAEIRQFIRRLMAMPFVPLGQVDEAFFISVAEVTWTAPITDLISYFTDTWLEEEALFTVDIWNHFSTDDNIRTNNNVEGWHSKLQKSGMSPKPNVYIFVNKMKEIEEENIAERRMLLCGSENPPQQKAVYKKVNDRLYSLKQRLLNQTISLRAYMDATTYIVKK